MFFSNQRDKHRKAFEKEKHLLKTGDIILNKAMGCQRDYEGKMSLIGIDYKNGIVHYNKCLTLTGGANVTIHINGFKVNTYIGCLDMCHYDTDKSKPLTISLKSFVNGYYGSYNILLEKDRLQKEIQLEEQKRLEDIYKEVRVDELELKMHIFEDFFNTLQLNTEQKQIILDRMVKILQ